MDSPTPQDHLDRAREFQETFDDSMREVGVRIPAPVLGQTSRDYLRKTYHALQQAILPDNHPLSSVDFRELKNDALQTLGPQLLQACKAERVNPRNVPPGELKPIKSFDEYGRVQETKFIGSYDPKWDSQESFVKHLGRAGRRVVAFMRSVEPIRR